MQPKVKSAEGMFTRMAYFNYNPFNHLYEYFSLDTRLPQMMSYDSPGKNTLNKGTVELAGVSFVAPQWGERINVPFVYRISITPVKQGQQTVSLYLTEQKIAGKEFLAFEYRYA